MSTQQIIESWENGVEPYKTINLKERSENANNDSTPVLIIDNDPGNTKQISGA